MAPNATSSFFSLIHPTTGGWRCLFTLPDRKHYWFDNAEDLARAALHLDSKGLAVFHSCATFTTKERKQEHVDALNCLWADIDAGLGKPYPDAAAAYRALESWRAKAQLPPGLVVVSGGGLHVYWPLRTPLGKSRWLAAASRLRALAAEHGLHIDPGSTIDAARILRPPGTNNRKLLDASGKKLADTGGTPRPVRAGPLVGPYTIEELKPLFDQTPDANAGIDAAVPDFLRGVNDDRAAAVTSVGGSDKPSDPRVVADKCAQVQRLRDSRGHLAEPEWYAVLGVLAHCGEPGRKAAHEWSSGDPRYSAADTEAKLDQYLKNAGGPTTCERFGQLVNGPCLMCPFAGKVTSPIQLGRDVPASTVAASPDALELPKLPATFFWKGQKLCIERAPTDGDPSDHHIISEYPIVVGELQETERSARISAVLRSWEPMGKHWRDFSIDLGALVQTTGHAAVANQGVIIPKKRWDHFNTYVNACAVEYRGSRHYGVRYEQFGWKQQSDGSGPGFVLGNEMLRRGAAPQRIHGNDEIEKRAEAMQVAGEVGKWSAAASKLIGHQGMEGHAFMLLAAFAAPLYKFTGEPGVTFVHGVSRTSGNGKTTILNAGQSVWGGRDATSITERDTMVAKFITMGTLCNLPIFFDELRFPTPEETKHYILQGTIGRDKQRGRPDGGTRADHLDWSTIHISAANISLMDTVRHDDTEVAQAARIFEFTLELPPGLKTTDGDEIRKELRANAGTAGRAFIQACVDNYEWLEKAVPALMRRYETVLDAGPDERFSLRLLACAHAAGLLVQQKGLLKIDLAAVMDWAVKVQRGNASRLAAEASVDPAAIVSQMINDLAPNTIVVEAPAQLGKPPSLPRRENRGELRARLERQTRRLLVEIATVRKWMQQHNHSFSGLQKELLEMKVLVEARVRRTLGAGTGEHFGQVWCWQLDGAHPLLADAVEPMAGEPPPPDNVVPLRGVG